MPNIIIKPEAIPKGQTLKCDSQLYIGSKAMKVPGIVKNYVIRTGQSLSHTSERQTVVHLLKTLALDDESESEINECFAINGSEAEARGVKGQ